MPGLKPIVLSVTCALWLAGCAGSAPRQPVGRPAPMVDVHTSLGMTLAAQGRTADALRHFQAAAALAPEATHAHNNLGYAYLLHGSVENAVRSLEQAQRLDPANETSARNLRAARARLESQGARATAAAAPTSAPAAARPPGSADLVEVAPQVFELKAPPRQARGARLEIANGNGVAGLATRVAGRLTAAGVAGARLTNQRPFGQARTELQYREGYAAEAARLAEKLRHPVVLVPGERLAPHIDLRLVLGRDAPTERALFAPRGERPVIARGPDGA